MLSHEDAAAHVPSTVHHIPPDKVCGRAKDVIRRLQKAGYEAYLVGGCVRDLLLGYTPKDFDIATSARPEEIRRLFNSCRLIGRRFRLAHIYYGRDYLEVATFRAPHDDDDAGGKVNDEGRIINTTCTARSMKMCGDVISLSMLCFTTRLAASCWILLAAWKICATVKSA